MSIFEEYGAFKCLVAAVKHLPVLLSSADYIFISFWIIKPYLVTLKI